jgi:hypothetical protein
MENLSKSELLKTKLSFLCCIAISAFLLLPVSGWCTDYYVDPVSGLDTNPGTSITTPWKTINWAIWRGKTTNYLPGDKIRLKCGTTFTETCPYMTGMGNGNAAQGYIYLDMYGTGDKPIIACAGSNALRFYDMSYWKIRNLQFTGDSSLRIPLYLYASGADVEHVTVEFCVIDGTNATGASTHHGINTTASNGYTMTDIEFYGNTIRNLNDVGAYTNNDGINCSGISANAWIHGNRVYNYGTGGQAFDLPGGSGHVIEYNRAYNGCSFSKVHGQLWPVEDVAYIYNSFHSPTGGNNSFGIALLDATNCIVTNNTMSMGNSGFGAFYVQTVSGNYQPPYGVIGNVVKNNIFSGANATNCPVYIGSTIPRSTWDNYNTMTKNDIYSGTNSNRVVFAGAILITTSNWLAEWLPDHPGDIDVDPLTRSATDLHLLSSSPCIDEAEEIGQVRDVEGSLLYNTEWDIGAYEWQGN